jgi:hypothetical protein
MEKMRWIVYRNFFKKVYVFFQFHQHSILIHRYLLTKEKLNNQIQLDKYCLPIIKKFDPDTTICIDELVVIVANLIHLGYIKGMVFVLLQSI